MVDNKTVGQISYVNKTSDLQSMLEQSAKKHRKPAPTSNPKPEKPDRERKTRENFLNYPYNARYITPFCHC
jgi:hypothetical protein